jgi:tryptophan synthase alpha chain
MKDVLMNINKLGESMTGRITAAKAQGRMALIPFLTAGYPGMDIFWRELGEMDAAGADIIEIGVPFSDPVADGPVVAAASQTAIANGMTLSVLLEGLKQRQGAYAAPLVLMGYYNPFLQYGLEKFAAAAVDAGVAGCIVPDLPLEEDDELRRALALSARGLCLIPLVGLNTPEKRLRAYARQAGGYVYLASVLGTTGQRLSFPPELASVMRRVKKIFSVPLALGFGFSRPEQLAQLEVQPQAVVFGSALLQHVAAGGRGADFLARWNRAV